MSAKMFQMDGPIPGENFTSDTKNYPWHRPPEFTLPDEAIDYLTKMFSREEAMFGVIGLLELDLDVVTITDILITKGISEGKWAVDLGLIIAGPVSHMIVIMAKGFDIPFRMGLKKTYNVPPEQLIKKARDFGKPTSQEKKAVKEELKAMKAQAPLGFMSGMPIIDEVPEVTESGEPPLMVPLEEMSNEQEMGIM